MNYFSNMLSDEPTAITNPAQISVCSFIPELIESAMYLFRATGDHTYLQLGLDALESIERIAKTPCGYATVRSVCLILKHFFKVYKLQSELHLVQIL